MAALIPYLSILILIAVGMICLMGRQFRPTLSLFLAEVAALAALALALGLGLVLWLYGAQTTPVLGVATLGLSVRLDLLSVVMLMLVALLGWVITRFSVTYLDGEPHQGAFMGWLLLTLAAVTALVSAGNLGQLVLGFIGAGIGLRKLLLTYPDRPRAQQAAARMRIASRAGDAALIGATTVLVLAFGTADIATLNETASGPMAVFGAGLLVLGGLLKAAQFPMHGWLTEVMEAPTPVSALLHAGIVNAGGFVLIRLADVLLTAPVSWPHWRFWAGSRRCLAVWRCWRSLRSRPRLHGRPLRRWAS